MKIYAYVVTKDFGFAPNPFFGVCTLATCKEILRGTIDVNDWVIGIGSSKNQHSEKLVYCAQVREKINTSDYWSDERFKKKKPLLNGSKKQWFGDNVYFPDEHGILNQVNSHHSHMDGSQNLEHLKKDTKAPVLVSDNFSYWGIDAIDFPHDILELLYKYTAIKGRNHRVIKDSRDVDVIEPWLRSISGNGLVGLPTAWSNPKGMNSREVIWPKDENI